MLIKCVECGSDVSDKAGACPRCGAPPSGAVASPAPAMALAARGPRVQTVEQTAKRWKSVQLVSVAFMCIGTVACVAQAQAPTAIFWLLGFGGYVVSRVGAWWENG